MSPQQDWVFGDVKDKTARRPAPSRTPPRPPRGRARAVRAISRFALFIVWLVCFTIGLTCTALFAAGLLRDGTFTDTRIALDLSRRGEWRRFHLHPWVPGQYAMYLVTVDREDHPEEYVFSGRVYVRVENQLGRLQLSERYEHPAVDHRLRGGVEWTRLGQVHINMPSFDPWTVAVRVGHADPAFSQVDSFFVVQRDKRIPGLEGLANYAAAAPALLFLALSVPAALGLPRRGGTWIEATLSIVCLAGVAAMVYVA